MGTLQVARSTDGPLWAILPDSGGYTVHPVPTPLSTIADKISRNREGSNIHILRLYNVQQE